MAGQHYFVVAGLSNPNGHGHVVVIVPGRKNGYAKGFWGSLSHPSEARENEGIDYAFTNMNSRRFNILPHRYPPSLRHHEMYTKDFLEWLGSFRIYCLRWPDIFGRLYFGACHDLVQYHSGRTLPVGV